ncbi:glycerol-3-phosphate 1-O-acyltransferase PlsY [Leptospira sp. GIMC2001]|uniref:glycerol-3-phosphate 1-O-acyltransferase PlsY n=1 Tax=Leptospira sp. GIMC2001 TaxID=1513297 RepID=UPI00234BBC78|nr:glycerol-3-phosphate 1-O-acyltransferase PlsY [Leptospira sp. GIMC2001]WCL48378.1 glycerol-3-phosphate 1-O-acyltransferase PlsY [Leptospira sp. GIMC2001]
MNVVVLFGIASYILGAIPFGFIIAKFFTNVDIREHGSKNIGATNVGRVIGWKYGFIVLILDVAKGAIPVLFGKFIAADLHDWIPLNLSLLLGCLAILGHVYTPFLKFKGGKGVATALGVCLSLVPLTTLAAVGVFFVVYKLSGYVSLGSMIASLSMPIIYYFFDSLRVVSALSFPLLYVLSAVAFVIIISHRENLVRIYKGQELKATLRKGSSANLDSK